MKTYIHSFGALNVSSAWAKSKSTEERTELIQSSKKQSFEAYMVIE